MGGVSHYFQKFPKFSKCEKFCLILCTVFFFSKFTENFKFPSMAPKKASTSKVTKPKALIYPILASLTEERNLQETLAPDVFATDRKSVV